MCSHVELWKASCRNSWVSIAKAQTRDGMHIRSQAAPQLPPSEPGGRRGGGVSEMPTVPSMASPEPQTPEFPGVSLSS